MKNERQAHAAILATTTSEAQEKARFAAWAARNKPRKATTPKRASIIRLIFWRC